MDTIFMNTKNSEIPHLHKLIFHLILHFIIKNIYEILTGNPSIRKYVDKIVERITFRVKLRIPLARIYNV